MLLAWLVIELELAADSWCLAVAQERLRLASSEEDTRDVAKDSYYLPGIQCTPVQQLLFVCRDHIRELSFRQLSVAAKSCAFHHNRMIKNSSPELHGAKSATENVSHGTLNPQICQTSEVPHKTSLLTAALVSPLKQSAAVSGLVARLPCKSAADASTASQTATTSFAFNGPYLYSPVMSSQPETHQILQVDLVGNQEKSVSLQGHESAPRHHAGKKSRSSAAFPAPRLAGNDAAPQ